MKVEPSEDTKIEEKRKPGLKLLYKKNKFVQRKNTWENTFMFDKQYRKNRILQPKVVYVLLKAMNHIGLE